MYSAKSHQSQRSVPGFTVQSLQKNTKIRGSQSVGREKILKISYTNKRAIWNFDNQVYRPPQAGSQRERISRSTAFKKFYERGDFPLMVEHGSRGNKIAWKADLQTLDYHYYLPLFFDGLCETSYPYCFIAKQGIYDFLEHGGPKVLPVLPQLIGPIRTALNTRNHQVVCTTLHVLQKLVTCVEGFGEALVPYYKQILPVLNLFKNQNLNTGDGIDYGQMRKENLGDLIQETLEVLEIHGGKDAYFHLKYMIPTYESCLGNSLKT